MKKKITVYSVFIVAYVILSAVLTSTVFKETELIVRFFINLVINSAILIIANVILNYNKNASIKTSFVNALLLAVFACVIALSVDAFTSGNIAGENESAFVSESTENITNAGTEVGTVQMEVAFSNQDTSSRIMQIVLDLLVAFCGGGLGIKLFRKRNANLNDVSVV